MINRWNHFNENRRNNRKTEDERAMTHFKIEEEDWLKMSNEEQEEKISKLPKRRGINRS